MTRGAGAADKPPGAFVDHASLARFVCSKGLPRLPALSTTRPRLALHEMTVIAVRSGLKHLAIELVTKDASSPAFRKVQVDHAKKGLTPPGAKHIC